MKIFLQLYVCLAWTLQLATSDDCEGALLATVSPSNVVQFGDQVLLYCTPSPDATEPVSWTKDPSLAIQTSGSNPCHCTAASNGTSRSVFLNVTDDADIAVYVCTLQLSFVLTCRASVQIFKAVPPVLTSVGSTSQTANQGSTVTFSVSLTDPGLPLANVVWSKDGVPLSNTSNMVVTSTTLQLSNIQAGDRGQYVATATNKAGSSDIHFRLFESFYPVVNLSVITSGSQAMLQCDAYGYPVLTEVTIVDTSSTSNIYTQDNYTSGGRATSTQQLTGCPTTFRCRASNGFGMTTVVMPICAVGVDTFLVKPVGSDGAFLQWRSATNAPAEFKVMYLLSAGPGSSAYTVGPTVTCQTCNFTISGLIPGGTYSFVIGYGSQVSQPMTTIVGSGLGAVTMVTATAVDSLSDQISVRWSPTPYASGYLVYVNYGMGGAFIANVTGGGTSTNVGAKCRALNTLQVQAYNSSAFSALSPGVQVYTYCSPNPAIKSVTTDNSILRITFTNVPFGAITITAVQDGSGYMYSWSVTPDANGMACLSGTMQGAGYSVCASFAQNISDCYPDKVSVGKGAPVQSCNSTIDGVAAASSSAGTSTDGQLQPLIIGIIIVATFAGVATLFCFVGLFLACRKRSTSDYDVTSSTCTSMKGSPTPPEASPYSQIDTRASHGEMVSQQQVPRSYNMRGRDIQQNEAYNKTFDRTWSDSFTKSQQGTCATEV
ncbi:hypothetical protein EMCRGX_G028904 [Ephydatia muelleri]